MPVTGEYVAARRGLRVHYHPEPIDRLCELFKISLRLIAEVPSANDSETTLYTPFKTASKQSKICPFLLGPAISI
jgi:hypothetical protein